MFVLTIALTALTPSAVAPEPAASKERLICRNLSPTGSRLGGERVCRTRAEWGRIAIEANRDLGRRPGAPGVPDNAPPPGR